MAKIEYSKEIRKIARKDGLSINEKIFSDLIMMGWDFPDAYLASGLYNPLYKLDVNMVELNKLKESDRFISYYNNKIAERNRIADEYMKNAQQLVEESSNVDFRSKDSIIDQLGKAASTLKGKDLADVLMKIADLQQMKKDENKEEEERVHFYLPANCPHTCKLFRT